jgi:hypothetical protein
MDYLIQLFSNQDVKNILFVLVYYIIYVFTYRFFKKKYKKVKKDLFNLEKRLGRLEGTIYGRMIMEKLNEE